MEFLIAEAVTIITALILVLTVLSRLAKTKFELREARQALKGAGERIRYYQLEQSRAEFRERLYEKMLCDDFID